MKKALIALLVLTTLFTSAVFAEDKQLWIDGVSLSLGMNKEVVIESFSKKHNLLQVEDKDDYVVMKKGESSAFNNVVGQIAFKNGKLSFASQTWGRFTTKDSLDMANSLYSSISGILNKGDKILRVKAETKRSPEMTINTIELIFTNKTIILSISDGRNIEKGVIIQENILKN